MNDTTKNYAKECLIAMELGITYTDYEMDELHEIIIKKIKRIKAERKKLFKNDTNTFIEITY